MVKEGYKQTEVGVIPEDWIVTSLGEEGSFKNGINKSADQFGFGFPFVNLMDIFGIPSISTEQGLGLLNSTPFEQSLYSVEKGDVLFVRSSVKPSGVGLTSLVKKDLKKTVFSGFIIRYRNDSISSDFKEHCFYRSDFRKRVIAASTSSANTNINQSNLSPILFALPPSHVEQKAIAEALSDVDGLIASLEVLIAKKHALKTATMQQLLTGKTRLDGFGAGKGMKQTELGEIPEDWDVVPLGEIGKPVIGLTYKPSDVSNEGTLVLRSSNIQNGVLTYENNVFVKHDLPQRVITSEGDLLICVRNGSRALIGKCALIDETAAGSAFGAFMSLFKSDDSKFVYFQFQSHVIKKQIEDTMGATINQITNKDLNRFRIPFPKSPEERLKIADLLENWELDIQSLNSRLNKTKALKQGMMQELLTGRTRLV
ncbi:restriction endonuclease subunit S [Lentilitoribacter sp. Alg239-R112]|uniref:restriction endonuclease subunit S n=1 Tax=Lentilitoribacter sp. Alg239-R112 TaxID=2305987 RepID=UPI0013A6D7CB|nr:restriction endonuclease subunit S [Lentilitoribacter sp. Alg239-R112]